MSIAAVFWDIGGVINRTENPRPRDELASELGVSREHLNHLFFSGPKGTLAQLGQITGDELMKYIRHELNLEPNQHPNLLQRFFGGDVVDHELTEYIRRLRPDYKIGVISNAWSQLDKLLMEWGILEIFDLVICSGDVGVMKPDPKIFLMALDEAEVEPHEAVFIDDFIENIHGAQSVGINTIHFQDKIQTLENLERLLGKDKPSN